MKAYRKEHNNCEWCGRNTNVLHVHHLVPVAYAPERAGDPTNFIVLCGTGARCHLTVGHGGNYKHFIENCREICDSNIIVKPTPIIDSNE